MAQRQPQKSSAAFRGSYQGAKSPALTLIPFTGIVWSRDGRDTPQAPLGQKHFVSRPGQGAPAAAERWGGEDEACCKVEQLCCRLASCCGGSSRSDRGADAARGLQPPGSPKCCHRFTSSWSILSGSALRGVLWCQGQEYSLSRGINGIPFLCPPPRCGTWRMSVSLRAQSPF